MRRRARVDANHAAIREALRRTGWEVTDLSALGGGMPDLLASQRGRTCSFKVVTRAFLIEVKDGSKPPSARKLTQAQIKLHAAFAKAGIPVCVVSSVQEAEAL